MALTSSKDSQTTPLLMPGFNYACVDEDQPQTFLSAAVDLARKRWVRIDGILHLDICRIVTVDVERDNPIRWVPRDGVADLVDVGFGDATSAPGGMSPSGCSGIGNSMSNHRVRTTSTGCASSSIPATPNSITNGDSTRADQATCRVAAQPTRLAAYPDG